MLGAKVMEAVATEEVVEVAQVAALEEATEVGEGEMVEAGQVRVAEEATALEMAAVATRAV